MPFHGWFAWPNRSSTSAPQARQHGTIVVSSHVETTIRTTSLARNVSWRRQVARFSQQATYEMFPLFRRRSAACDFEPSHFEPHPLGRPPPPAGLHSRSDRTLPLEGGQACRGVNWGSERFYSTIVVIYRDLLATFLLSSQTVSARACCLLLALVVRRVSLILRVLVLFGRDERLFVVQCCAMRADAKRESGRFEPSLQRRRNINDASAVLRDWADLVVPCSMDLSSHCDLRPQVTVTWDDKSLFL